MTHVVIVGGGPGGYTAAFRAADLGLQVTLIEKRSVLGGVCLNDGCIPSKALLHAAHAMRTALELKDSGLQSQMSWNIKDLIESKNKTIHQLNVGLASMAKRRKVRIMHGHAALQGPKRISVEKSDQSQEEIDFDYCVLASGSRPVVLPIMPDDSRILDSTTALNLSITQGSMLVIGGGIIGLEMATIYSALGVQVTVVEAAPQMMPGADAHMLKPLLKKLAHEGVQMLTQTKVTHVNAQNDGIHVTFGDQTQRFDSVLVAIGRKPNTEYLGLEKVGIQTNARGLIEVDTQQRTTCESIFAIGDIVPGPGVAHKATLEGRVAAEVISGKKHYCMPKCIPLVAYTDPEIAWVGLTEQEAKAQSIPYHTKTFPWAASGRAIGMKRSEGLTQWIVHADSHQVIGGAITGVHAGDLIAEMSLAIEMGCDIADVALTVHPHPTLSETIAFAAEMIEGTATDI